MTLMRALKLRAKDFKSYRLSNIILKYRRQNIFPYILFDKSKAKENPLSNKIILLSINIKKLYYFLQ